MDLTKYLVKDRKDSIKRNPQSNARFYYWENSKENPNKKGNLFITNTWLKSSDYKSYQKKKYYINKKNALNENLEKNIMLLQNSREESKLSDLRKLSPKGFKFTVKNKINMVNTIHKHYLESAVVYDEDHNSSPTKQTFSKSAQQSKLPTQRKVIENSDPLKSFLRVCNNGNDKKVVTTKNDLLVHSILHENVDIFRDKVKHNQQYFVMPDINNNNLESINNIDEKNISKPWNFDNQNLNINLGIRNRTIQLKNINNSDNQKTDPKPVPNRREINLGNGVFANMSYKYYKKPRKDVNKSIVSTPKINKNEQRNPNIAYIDI